MANKTTKKHFELFKKECQFWIDILNLNNYEINFSHESCEFYGEKIFAITSRTYNSRYVDIIFSDTFHDKEPTDELIKRYAQHEVFEVLLNDMWILASARSWDEDQWDAAGHDLIHRLQYMSKKLMEMK